MAKSQHLRLVSNTYKETVLPRLKPDAALRPREYLTEDEVDQLMTAAGDDRSGHRDATMILVAFRHALRPGELVALRWDDVDLVQGKLHANRAKNGSPGVYSLSNVELWALRRLQRESEGSPFVFASELGAPFKPADFRRLVARLSIAAKFGFVAHPRMLRVSCGFKLVKNGKIRSLRDYPDHKSFATLYAELSPDRFDDFWED